MFTKMINNVIAVIDIGSNSIRERISVGNVVLFRNVITTQLAKDLSPEGYIDERSINRTIDGLFEFYQCAKRYDVEKIYCFATAVVRNSKNGKEFVKLVNQKLGINVEVISGEKEAEIGLLGAFGGQDGAILDIGGASTELTVAKNKKIVYVKSINIGAVRVTDICGRDIQKVTNYCKEQIESFDKNVKLEKIYAIGGTANTLAYIVCGLKKYDRDKQNGCKLTFERLNELINQFSTLCPEDISEKYNIKLTRAQVILSGAVILQQAMLLLNLNEITLCENDNLEGYLLYNLENLRYEK